MYEQTSKSFRRVHRPPAALPVDLGGGTCQKGALRQLWPRNTDRMRLFPQLFSGRALLSSDHSRVLRIGPWPLPQGLSSGAGSLSLPISYLSQAWTKSDAMGTWHLQSYLGYSGTSCGRECLREEPVFSTPLPWAWPSTPTTPPVPGTARARRASATICTSGIFLPPWSPQRIETGPEGKDLATQGPGG